MKAVLTGEIGLSERSAALLVDEYGELDVQLHAMYCLWMMYQGKVHTPPAWLTASLKGDWNPPRGMPSERLPTALRFCVDEKAFAEFAREIRDDKKASSTTEPHNLLRSWGFLYQGCSYEILHFPRLFGKISAT